MIGMEVRLNGQLLCTAGQDNGDVMAVIDLVGWRLPDGTRPPSSLEVTGIHEFARLEWTGAQGLVAGDELVIRIVEPALPDEPARNRRDDAEDVEAQERLTYEWLKQKYG